MPSTLNNTPGRLHHRLADKVGLTWLAAPVIAAVAAWTILAGGDTAKCKVDVTQSSEQVCEQGAGPVNVEVKIDATMFRGDPRIAAAAANAAVRYTEIPIQYGGTIQISAFGRTAARSRVLFTKAIPTRDELRLSQRAGLQNDLRAKVKVALARLADDDLGDEFAAGSDILGAYTLRPNGDFAAGLPLLRVVLTDGRVQVPRFNLIRTLRQDGEVQALRQLKVHLPKARGPKPDGLVIAGIGGTGGLVPDEDPALTDSLTVVHERLCKEIAHTCNTTSSL